MLSKLLSMITAETLDCKWDSITNEERFSNGRGAYLFSQFGTRKFYRGLGFLFCRPPDFDVVDLAGIIEGTEADKAWAEIFIFGGHDRNGHVVEIDFDGTVGDFPLETNFVPDVQPPTNASGSGLGDVGAGRIVHEENVMGVGVGFGGDVRVVELFRILKTEEETHIAMAILAAGLD